MKRLVLVIIIPLVFGCKTQKIEIKANDTKLSLVKEDTGKVFDGLTLTHIPSVVIYTTITKVSLQDSLLLKNKLNPLKSALPKSLNAKFIYSSISDANIKYENEIGTFIFDNKSNPEKGIIFSDGIKQPQYFKLTPEVDFFKSFTNYFDIHTRAQLKNYIRKRENKENRGLNKKFRAKYNEVLAKISIDYVPEFNKEQVQQINAILLRYFDFLYGYNYNESYFTKPFKTIFIQIVDGSWKGRKSKVMYNEKNQRVYSDWLIYDGKDFYQNYLTYHEQGLLKNIQKLHYREDLDVNYEDILHFFWRSETELDVYSVSYKQLSAYHSDDLDRISLVKLEFNTDYSLKSKEHFIYNGETDKITPSNYKLRWTYSKNPETIKEEEIREQKNFAIGIQKLKDGKVYEHTYKMENPYYYIKSVTKDNISRNYNEEGELLSYNTLKYGMDYAGYLVEHQRLENDSITEKNYLSIYKRLKVRLMKT